MVRRVLLARGGSLSITNGLGRAHNSIVSVLNRALVPNWTKVKVIEHQIVSNIFLSIFKRWKQHPKLVSEETSKMGIDLLHITDQEQAHLVPYNSKIPVVVTIHDLFHIRPRTIEAGDVYISVGEQKPNMIRKRDLLRLKAGLKRADLLICISEETRADVKKLLPGKETALVRNDIDIDYWNPYLNPISRDIISEYDDTSNGILSFERVSEIFGDCSNEEELSYETDRVYGIKITNDLDGYVILHAQDNEIKEALEEERDVESAVIIKSDNIAFVTTLVEILKLNNREVYEGESNEIWQADILEFDKEFKEEETDIIS